MPFTTDTDQDGAGWDNALDKLAIVGGAGTAALGTGLAALGGLGVTLGTVANPASPLLIPGGLALAGIGGALGIGGAMLGASGSQGMVGDTAQGALGLGGMAMDGIAGTAEWANDFLFPPKMAPGT